MGLKELADSVNRRPELSRHPDSQRFIQSFPIIKVKASFNKEFDEELIFIIQGQGDTQRHKTNVKADMTDWFMQKQHPQFQMVGDRAIEIARKNSPHDLEMELYDCWGAIYKKNDWTKVHDHWPHVWSFVYYIQCGSNDSPIQFPDADLSIYPISGEIVIFPGWVRHKVPLQGDDSERIIVSGNISPVKISF